MLDFFDCVSSVCIQRFSFIQSLLEPSFAGPGRKAQHSYTGWKQLHLSHQVPLYAKCYHYLHQQEQDQQLACVCGRNPTEIPEHKVSLRHFAFLDRDEVAACAATLLRQSCFLIFFIFIGS